MLCAQLTIGTDNCSQGGACKLHANMSLVPMQSPCIMSLVRAYSIEMFVTFDQRLLLIRMVLMSGIGFAQS